MARVVSIDLVDVMTSPRRAACPWCCLPLLADGSITVHGNTSCVWMAQSAARKGEARIA